MGEPYDLATRLVHGAGPHPLGAVATPVFDTASFALADHEAHARAVADPVGTLFYTRLQNPTVAALERVLASADSAPRALAFASGMAAISTTLLALLRGGGHIVASSQLFVATRDLLQHDLPAFGATVTFADLRSTAALSAAIRADTRAVFVETFTNPGLDVLDLPALVSAAHERGVLVVVDNTFASPALIRPVELGADLVVQSATKYLSGHGRTVAGAVAGGEELVAGIAALRRTLGSTISPHNAAAIIDGMRTLPLRMARASTTAQRLAELAAEHDAVEHVAYPGLPGPNHELAKRLTGGAGFGGMLSLRLRDRARKAAVYDAFGLIVRATSLGDTTSLVDWIDEPDVLRISVGVEDPTDLATDLEKALDAAL